MHLTARQAIAAYSENEEQAEQADVQSSSNDD